MGVAAAIAGAAVVGAVATTAASNKSANAQKDAAKTASAQVASSTGQARQDLFKLFPAAQQNTQQGYQGALDVFKQSLPQQANTFQQGNVAAQNQLLAGMPQFQNAILGAPVDYSQFQATELQQPNFDFANQQLSYVDPYKQTSTSIQNNTANNPPEPQWIYDNLWNGSTQPRRPDIGSLLGGKFNNRNYF